MLQPSPENKCASERDYRECREAIRAGSRSFFSASLLLPRAIRKPVYGLYAFCRLSDDAVDVGAGSPQAIERLRDRLNRAFEGQPYPIAADRAMADLLQRFAIPRTLPEALLEGFAWDAAGRQYQDLPALNDYAARVAGTIGVIMGLMMGVRSAEALARASDLGVAMQLTNIARDVGEDARAGRLYLPLQWMREVGIAPEIFLANPVPSAAIQIVVQRLLREAAALYARAHSGVAHLPAPCRPAILAAATVYAEIGRRIESASYDSITRRARVPGGRKLTLIAASIAKTPWLRLAAERPPLAANAFLVNAAVHAPLPVADAVWRAPPHKGFKRQMLRVLEIYERLERAERFGVKTS